MAHATALQRVPTLGAGARTLPGRHQAAIGPYDWRTVSNGRCSRCCGRRPLARRFAVSTTAPAQSDWLKATHCGHSVFDG